MSQNPRETKGGVSAISKADRAIVVKPPYALHLDRVPMLGDKVAKRIVAAACPWFIGQTPVGDFSGNDAGIGGNGGPADLACPWSPTGSDTIMAAGMISDATGASTSLVPMSLALDPMSDYAIDELVAPTTSVAWTSTGNKLTKSGIFASYTYQAGDLAFIDQPATGCVRGYVPIAGKTSSDEITLSTSIKTGTAANVKLSVHRPYWTYTAAVMKRFGTPISIATADWTAATRTITKTGGFTTYTFTGDDWLYVSADSTSPSTSILGWYRIQSRTSNDAIVLTDDASILNTGDLSAKLTAKVYPAYNAISCESAAWDSSSKTLTLSGAFASYTPGADDTVWFRSIDGSDYTDQYFVKVSSKTSNDAIVLADDPIGSNAATVHATVLKRGSFEQKTVSTTRPWYGNAAGAVNSVLNLASALSFTPAIGDLYYVWPSATSDDTNHALAATIENDPEGIPVAMDSSTTTQGSWWPFWTPNRVALASYQGYAQRANYASSAQNTDICTHWHGNFITPAGTFCHGDELEIRISGDLTNGPQPFYIELLLIPNFNPDADWYTSGATDNANRLPKAIVFYTRTITSSDIAIGASNNIDIMLRGKAMGLSTVSTVVSPAGSPDGNWTQAWSAEFRFGSFSGTTVMSPLLVGPFNITYDSTGIDFGNEDVKWSLLMKVDHPSMRGKPGYHGYYFNEPFSATTGNGGSMLYPAGTQTTATLPFSPRIRLAYFSVDWKPSGSF